MHLTVRHFLRPKPCLIQAAGGGAVYVSPHEGIQGIHGECLLGKEYFTPCPLPDTTEYAHILFYKPLVHNIAGGLYLVSE